MSAFTASQVTSFSKERIRVGNTWCLKGTQEI